MAPLRIFLTTWNTGLQGSKAQEQDLTSWLLPVLHKANDPTLPEGVVPDIYAIAVQELLPLHLALAGLSGTVLLALTKRIQSLLSSHATSLSSTKQKEDYSLVSRTAHGGHALWIFARDSTMSGRIGKPLRAYIGFWRFGMGNKGAVGVKVPIQRGENGDQWETLTFVCTHLEAHDRNLRVRNEQYRTILTSLIFPSPDPLSRPSQVFETSHLFLMGDLNYRLASLPSEGHPTEGKFSDDVVALEKERAEMFELDTLRTEQKAGRVFGGLREGDITRFAPTYKRIVGQVDGYSRKRIPGYTDRILFASYNDSSDSASSSSNRIHHYSSTPEITLSDHKPVHALLELVTPSQTGSAVHSIPTLPSPPPPHPDWPPPASPEGLMAYKLIGAILNKVVGWPWCVLVLLGWGHAGTGLGVTATIAMIWGAWSAGIWSG